MCRLINLRNWMLLAVFLTVILAAPAARRLTFDQTIESFFAPDNADIQRLRQTRDDFGGDEFVVVAWREPGLLSEDADRGYPELSDTAVERIELYSQQLGSIPGVDGGNTRDLAKFFHRLPRSRNLRNAMLRMFRGLLIGDDNETTAILLQLVPQDETLIPRRETLNQIRTVARQISPHAAVAGEAVLLQDMFELVERDGNHLYLISLFLLSAILLMIFRQWRWVLASIGIVVASVTCTRAVLVVADVQLSMVSSMLNSLVTIISISTTTHLIVCYREFRNSMNARDATLQTIRTLWYPTAWTLITIAVGFAALLVSEIVPVRSFATMMTLGTVMVLLLTIAILPAAFASGTAVPVPGRVHLENVIDRVLTGMAGIIDRHPVVTAGMCLLLTAMTLPGLFMMQVETDFSRNFRESSPVVQSLKFVESELGPAGTWDISFAAPNPVTNEFLKEMEALTESLGQLVSEGIEIEILSLSDAINIPPRIGTPASRFESLQKRQKGLVQSFYNPSRGRMRIMLRSPEQQPTDRKLSQIRRVREVVSGHFASLQSDHQASNSQPPTASGPFVLMARVIQSLLGDQFKSLFWASVGTVVCMTVAFRSIRIGLISLVPNLFPVALVTGALGLMQIPLNIGTAMIASVSMGFTCSVHYIAVFQESFPRDGISKALETAQAGVGKAVVLAHIALVAGFLVLTTSEFIPLVYFGALLSFSLIGGLISDLILLPLLLRWTTKEIRHADRRADNAPADANSEPIPEASTTESQNPVQ